MKKILSIALPALLVIVLLQAAYLKRENTFKETKEIKSESKLPEKKENEEGQEKEPDFVKLSVQETAELWEAYERTPKNPELDNSNDPWIPLGPNGSFNRTQGNNNSKYSGKVLDIELTDPAFYRVGSANGGLWEQLFIGTPVCLSNGMTSQKIGAFASNYLNTNEIYAGTGELTSNRGRLGTGVFKTTNKGVNWTNILPASNPQNLDAVSKVLYNPLFPEIVHISGSGVINNYMRTTNGGITWFKTFVGTGFITDMVINPLSPTILYAAVWNGGTARNIYKSTDSGSTWNLSPAGSGLPTINLGNISLALCNDQPNTVFALIAKNDDSNLEGIYKTINGGTNWTKLITPPAFDILSGQGFHANAITVSPIDPNIVVAGGIFLIRSTNGGTTWDSVTSPWRGNGNVHADMQSFEWGGQGSELFLANDGGVARSSDGGVNFTTTTNTFPISEAVYFDISQNNGGYLATGLEHNGISVTSNEGATWNVTITGDGSGVAIHPTNPTQYFATLGVFSGSPLPFRPFYSTNSGFDWVEITNNITNGCGQWYNQIRSNRTANGFAIYVNICKTVYRSMSNGTSWQNLNMPTTPAGFIDNGFDVVPITGQVLVSTTDSSTANTGKVMLGIGTAWFDISPNIGNKVLQKTKPGPMITAITKGATDSNNKIYKMNLQTFLSPNWQSVPGNGLSKYPLTDIIVSSLDTNRMIVGTQGWGNFVTTNGGQNWYPWNEGLPNGLIITEMKIQQSQQGEDYIYISTYGRGIFKRKLNAKVVSVANENETVNKFELKQNYPNPFNPITSIKFTIKEKDFVTLGVYDVNGKEVASLINGEINHGTYLMNFDGTNFSSGIYFYKLTGKNFSEVKKMMLIK